ncbi:MAG: hypothetical protein J3R72DRAFT_479210 [Linnemannia gamsii]|nr:MAG: hypothetical protein J3R72DRAFT_479210 [Linnemannia gamsii]
MLPNNQPPFTTLLLAPPHTLPAQSVITGNICTTPPPKHTHQSLFHRDERKEGFLKEHCQSTTYCVLPKRDYSRFCQRPFMISQGLVCSLCSSYFRQKLPKHSILQLRLHLEDSQSVVLLIILLYCFQVTTPNYSNKHRSEDFPPAINFKTYTHLATAFDPANTLSRYHGHEETVRQPKSAKLVLFTKKTKADQKISLISHRPSSPGLVSDYHHGKRLNT